MRKTPSKAYRDKITNLVGVRLLILSQQDRYVVKRKKVWMKFIREVHRKILIFKKHELPEDMKMTLQIVSEKKS